jgi:uncharacterized protein (DUF58 family)
VRTSASREGIYYLLIVFALFIGAFVREVNAMLLFAMLLLAPVSFAWYAGRKTLRKITVKRTVPDRIFAGTPFTIGIEVAKTRTAGLFFRSSWGIVVTDRLRRLSQTEPPLPEKMLEPAVYFPYLPGGQTVYQSYSGCLPQRGRYRFERVRVSTLFPFGFFRNWADLPVEMSARNNDSEFCVYPQIGRLSNRWRVQQRETEESLQRTRFRRSRQVGEFLGVRPWQQGDAKRNIHWRSFAKHRSPVVRQYELNQNRDYAVILDLFDSGQNNDAISEHFELAVSFTATLVTDWVNSGSGTLFFAANNKHGTIFDSLHYSLLDTVLKQLASAVPGKHDYLQEILLKVPAQVHSEIIFVTFSGSGDHLASRLSALQSDSRLPDVLRRFRIVDTSGSGFDELFTAGQ